MSVARKRYNPDEKRVIIKMAKDGFCYKDIAARVRPGVSTAWRSIGEIVRGAREQAVVANVPGSGVAKPLSLLTAPINSSSLITLPDELHDSVTAAQIMAMLDDSQREVFVATYEDLRGQADEDTVTRAENEMLMRAALSHTQYLRAAAMYARCESYLIDDLEGNIIDPADPRKRMAGRGDSYKKEMETKHKEYMDLISGLHSSKISKIKDSRPYLFQARWRCLE